MSKNDFWKKAGWFVVSILPAFLSLVLQFGAGMVVMLVITFKLSFANYNTGIGQEELMNLAMETYMSNTAWIVMLYQSIAIIIFGLWYYLVWGRKKRPQNAEKPGIKTLFYIVLLGIFLQISISSILVIVEEVFPNLMKSYIEMMEAAGLLEMNLAAVLASVIMAPVGEEVLCRGIMLRLAGKVSNKFWAANCIQALAFGIIHANLVQGTYAFFLGLVLGYIYGKYRNIWLCMLLHASVNLSSNFVPYLGNMLPGQHTLFFTGLLCAGSLAFIILIYLLLGKIKPLGESSGESMEVAERL